MIKGYLVIALAEQHLTTTGYAEAKHRHPLDFPATHHGKLEENLLKAIAGL